MTMISGIAPYVNNAVQDGIGSTIKFSRAEDGSVILNFTDAKNAKIENVGTVSGNAQLLLGITSEEDDFTMFQYVHEGDSENEFKLANIDGNHYNIVGENANVTTEAGNAEKTIQVDAKNSNIDLSKSEGAHVVYMSETSSGNKTTLGYGGDNYIDAGQFNHATNKGGNDRMESALGSYGSVMIGGSGNETFLIGGKYGIYDGGAGSDKFQTLGDTDSQDGSYRNIIIGGAGDDHVIDKGEYNIFFGGSGKNTYEAQGHKGIAQLGSEGNAAVIGSSADKTYIFAEDEATDTKGNTYNIYEIMNKYHWTLYEFLNIYSQISAIDNRSLATSGVVDEKTMKKLEEYFANNEKK